MNGEWRIYRPAIWLAMLGVALILLVTPDYVGAIVLGVSIGVAIRITTGRRRGRRVAQTVNRGRRGRGGRRT